MGEQVWTVYSCDRCGAQVALEAQAAAVVEPGLGPFTVPKDFGLTAIPGHHAVGILCSTCHAGFVEWWNSAASRGPGPTLALRRGP